MVSETHSNLPTNTARTVHKPLVEIALMTSSTSNAINEVQNFFATINAE